MKKVLLFSVMLSFYFGFSQGQDCKFVYNVSVELGKPDLPWDAFAKVSYDFSKLNLENDHVKIEVVGILDCWNNLDASQLRKVVVGLDSKQNDFKAKGTFNLVHNDLMAKCFKYRVVVKNNKCEEVSDWKFVTYNF